MTTIHLSPDYALHVECKPVVTGDLTLDIHSQWLSAKDPEGLQRKFQVTAAPAQLLALADVIRSAALEQAA